MNENYYSYKREDIVDFIPMNKYNSLLDIGCGKGMMGEHAKEKFQLKRICGVEINENQGKIAKKKYEKVFIGDIESNYIFENEYFQTKFDIITFADVLEHLKDPWIVLKNTKTLLKDNGIVIASIPNLAHWSALKAILQDKWLYTDAGILDRSHLRFFTKATILDLFKSTGYSILKMGVEKYPGYKKKIINTITLNKFEHLFIGKYLILAKISTTHL